MPWSASTLFGPGTWRDAWSRHPALKAGLHLFPSGSLPDCQLPESGLLAVPDILEPDACEFASAIPWDSLIPTRPFDGVFLESGPPSPMLAFLIEQSLSNDQPILFYECRMHGGDIDLEVCWNVRGGHLSRHQDWVEGMARIGVKLPSTGWFAPHTSTFDWKPFRLEAAPPGDPPSLFRAAERQDWARLEELLTRGHSPLHYRRRSPLTLAVAAGQRDVTRRLLSLGARARFWELAEAGDLELVSLLLEAGAEPTAMSARSVLAKGNEPGFLRLEPMVKLSREEVFLSACRGGVVSLLEREHRAKPDLIQASEYGRSALSYAAEGGHQKAVDWLLSHGANWDGSSLHHLAVEGHLELLRQALESGLSPQEPHFGRLALAEAASKSQLESMAILVAFGASIVEADEFRTTALHGAARGKSLTALDWLIARGADLEARDTLGCTPLWVAVGSGEQSTVDRLLAAGADSKTCNDFATPLSVLAEQRDIVLWR